MEGSNKLVTEFGLQYRQCGTCKIPFGKPKKTPQRHKAAAEVHCVISYLSKSINTRDLFNYVYHRTTAYLAVV